MSKEVILWASKGVAVIADNMPRTIQSPGDLKLPFQSEFIEVTADSYGDCSTFMGAYQGSMIYMGTREDEFGLLGFLWPGG